jgi:hypothetical protein
VTQTRALGTAPQVLRAVGILVIAAVAIGAITSPAQQFLPDAIRPLSNAAGPWFVVILIAVRLGRSPLVLGMVLGVTGFLLLTLSYGLVTVLRGSPWAFVNVWTIVAIPAGIVVGIAASWLGSPRRFFIALGAIIPAIVVLAEGVYGLVEIVGTTGPVVWIAEIVGALVWMAWVWATRLRASATSGATT